MNIYKLTQEVITGYNTYDSAIVVASSEEKAKRIHPSGFSDSYSSSWPNCEHVTATLIGKLNSKADYEEGDIICSSFNAG